jgi:hypothetical protein
MWPNHSVNRSLSQLIERLLSLLSYVGYRSLAAAKIFRVGTRKFFTAASEKIATYRSAPIPLTAKELGWAA